MSECRISFEVMLNVVKLNVVMLSVIMLNVVMLDVVAPDQYAHLSLGFIFTQPLLFSNK